MRPKDYKKALECYESASEQDNSEAIRKIGKLHYHGGYGVEKNYSKAKDYYELSCKKR